MSVYVLAKFVRARYIRVAAIDIAISEGSWNICVAETHKSRSHVVAIKTYEVERT